MKLKMILAGIGALALSYEIGKISGMIKISKCVIDTCEEIIPGTKQAAIKGALKGATDGTVNHILSGCMFKESQES